MDASRSSFEATPRTVTAELLSMRIALPTGVSARQVRERRRVSNVPVTVEASDYRMNVANPESLLRAALVRFGIRPTELVSLRCYENATYRVVGDTGEAYVVRIRSPRYTKQELGSEMQWLAAMREAGALVPAPLASPEGELVVAARDGTGQDERNCTAQHWLGGVSPDEEALLAADFEAIGFALGALHRASASFVPSATFSRPAWDDERWASSPVQATLAATATALRTGRGAHDSDRLAPLLNEAVTLMRRQRVERADYGLVHADCHPGNIVFDAGAVGLIDFEDLGWGSFVYDMASMLFGALERADYPAVVSAFCAGYARARPLARDIERQLRLLQLVRAVFLSSLAVSAAEDLGDNGWWQGYVKGRVQLLLTGAPQRGVAT
jgi:Ser/Thr protein kinase RdoA (MazF antagonist)